MWVRSTKEQTNGLTVSRQSAGDAPTEEEEENFTSLMIEMEENISECMLWHAVSVPA